MVNNWIDVGASGKYLDLKLPAGFSNYGRRTVDLFAPGVDIRSTSPKNKYRVSSGTSDASPVVTGVAALILSYYPKLTAVQLKEIIIESSRKYPKQKVKYWSRLDNREKQHQSTTEVVSTVLSNLGRVYEIQDSDKIQALHLQSRRLCPWFVI